MAHFFVNLDLLLHENQKSIAKSTNFAPDYHGLQMLGMFDDEGWTKSLVLVVVRLFYGEQLFIREDFSLVVTCDRIKELTVSLSRTRFFLSVRSLPL